MTIIHLPHHREVEIAKSCRLPQVEGLKWDPFHPLTWHPD